MRKLMLLAAVTTIVLGATAGGASATTFDGSCTMSGKIVPTTPYTFVPRNMDAEVFGKGTCTGTLDGQAYSGPAHIYIDGRMDTPMSCGLLVAKDVPGVLTFGRDPALVDATQLDIIAAEALELFGQLPARIKGAYNGHAVMRLALGSDEQTLNDCAGDGISEVPFDLELHTARALYG